ncbi:EAL domain-containing protein [Ectothiorhodospiraceae bacterium 2226]|nr:EAL domain-containing protein [Ectothiorhodospiraceae bacterium 2226]
MHNPPRLESAPLRANEGHATLAGAGLFQRVVETMREGAASLGIDGTLHYCNRGLCTMLGRSVSQLRGSSLHQYLVQDRELTADLLEQAALAEHTAEAMLRRSDGSVLHARLSFAPLENPGAPLCLVVTDLSHERRHSEALAAERLARSILEQAAEAVVVCDPEGRIIRASAKAHELCGYSPMFKRFEAAFPLHFDSSTLRGRSLALDYVLSGNLIRGADARMMRPRVGGLDTLVSHLLVSAAPLRDEAGAIVGCVVSLSDITPLKRTEEKLRLAANALANTADGVVITDRAGAVVTVNKAFTDISGYRAEDVVGQRLLAYTGRRDRLPEAMWQQLGNSGRWQGEVWTRHKSGRRFPISLSVSAVCDEASGARHYVAVISDISQRKEDEQRLAYMAHHDTLTELPNRLLLQERFAEAAAGNRGRARKRPMALLYIDLDGFKAVNDSLGHAAGDTLLQAVARRFAERVREHDTVARLGGDEFAILLNGLPPHEAGAMAQALIDSLSEPFTVAGHVLYVSASIGISGYPSDGRDVDELLKNADVAMYRAKEQGRSTFRHYRPEMNARALDHLLMASHLHQALERGEFQLDYQPCIDLRSGRINSVEALLRWRHPTLGLVAPERFIPLAEETGIIRVTGDWVLRTACRQAKAWQDAGLAPIPMGVNLSARQFHRPKLVARVLDILEETGLAPEWLKLEITESCMIRSADHGGRILRELADAGVQIAIDDFGTGYSSLSYLKQFPIHYLKIDKSFISGLPHDGDDAAITDTILTMAKGLSMKVIAEGVETDAQCEFLRRRDCEEGQGFLFSRPRSGEAVQALLQQGHVHRFDAVRDASADSAPLLRRATRADRLAHHGPGRA